jgi:hypothetical protein
MKLPPEALKAFCNRLAAASLSEEGTLLARQLRLAGMLGEPFLPASEAAPASAPRHELPADDGTERVGLWERRRGEAHFVRRMDRARSGSCGPTWGGSRRRGTRAAWC